MKAVRTPNFFIVGAARCGTTAMYSYLKAHPDIFMPLIKEPAYFATDFPNSYPSPVRTPEKYFALFADARDERRVGEGSTLYLSSRRAAENIKAFCPSARIIVMLRDPVEMMYSLHAIHVSLGIEKRKDFREALASRSDDPQLRYRERARYREQLERYFAAFGRENVLVLLFDDFVDDTARVYGDTLRFLGVDDDFRPEFDADNAWVTNPHLKLRSPLLHRVGTRPPEAVRRVVSRVVSEQGFARLQAGLNRLLAWNMQHGPRPPLDPDLSRDLHAEFAPEVAALSELLGRDLTSVWSLERSSVRAQR